MIGLLCTDIMTENNSARGRRVQPLYYPSGDVTANVEIMRPRGNTAVSSRCWRVPVGDEDTWHFGPMSQELMTTQLRWSEIKLWLLYYRSRLTIRAKWPELLSLEMRLTCSWYFQLDCMVIDPALLVRRVRNEFCLKSQKSRVKFLLMTSELF